MKHFASNVQMEDETSILNLLPKRDDPTGFVAKKKDET